ncbi:HCL500Cp [Eremothecium sinecaudum]|uniref:HCL500Cp n=1 Tax=Eremothecium sinecaudum TaxID=45286 RepID=A0A120K1S4_9SACH|nr:HCL500Cp [Eremothecium sinecaudum]AMD19651.1 HCL500Cp [Eremothecium sinecaudum]
MRPKYPFGKWFSAFGRTGIFRFSKNKKVPFTFASISGIGRGTFSKVVLAILIPYSTYALYISFMANRRINERAAKIKHEDSLEFNDTLIKYSQLQILGRFENPFTEYRIQTVYEFFANRIIELFQRKQAVPNLEGEMGSLMPVHKPDWTGDPKSLQQSHSFGYEVLSAHDATAKNSEPNMHTIYSTWLGQSCNYVVYRGIKILTDPIFSDYLLHETLGPKRITAKPAEIEKTPIPDIIIVSHNHPDHLDHVSMRHWGSDCARQPLWIIPKGLGHFLERNKVTRYVELSWWETCQLNFTHALSEFPEKLEIVCTPAMHWSGRGILDVNRSLWASFLLRDDGKPVLFHAGDTGYVKDLYIRIKEKFGSGVKLALLPCGQYCPEWHQRPRHINPEEVIKVMKDLEAQNVLGIHWGTFTLSSEYFREPKERLEMLAELTGIRNTCYCPELGKTIAIR